MKKLLIVFVQVALVFLAGAVILIFVSGISTIIGKLGLSESPGFMIAITLGFVLGRTFSFSVLFSGHYGKNGLIGLNDYENIIKIKHPNCPIHTGKLPATGWPQNKCSCNPPMKLNKYGEKYYILPSCSSLAGHDGYYCEEHHSKYYFGKTDTPCGKMTVDAFGGNPHPCPITKPCGKHEPVVIKKQVAKTLQKAIRDIYLFTDDYPHAEAQHKAEITVIESYLKSAYEQGCLAKEEAIIKLIKNNTGENIYRDGETAFDIVRDIKTL